MKTDSEVARDAQMLQSEDSCGNSIVSSDIASEFGARPEFISGLTVADIDAIVQQMPGGSDGFHKEWDFCHFARAIEQAHGVGGAYAKHDCKHFQRNDGYSSQQYLVRFGWLDQTRVKTIFFKRRKQAINAANAIGFVFWGEHSFKRSNCQLHHRVEAAGFWVEFKAEVVHQSVDQDQEDVY